MTERLSTDDAGPPGRPHAAVEAPAPDAPELEVILRKLKLLEHGLYGLQQYGRNAPLDVEDIGPFYRLAEEIESDVLALQQRRGPRRAGDSAACAASAACESASDE